MICQRQRQHHQHHWHQYLLEKFCSEWQEYRIWSRDYPIVHYSTVGSWFDLSALWLWMPRVCQTSQLAHLARSQSRKMILLGRSWRSTLNPLKLSVGQFLGVCWRWDSVITATVVSFEQRWETALPTSAHRSHHLLFQSTRSGRSQHVGSNNKTAFSRTREQEEESQGWFSLGRILLSQSEQSLRVEAGKVLNISRKEGKRSQKKLTAR